MALGDRIGVSGTPTVFINGWRYGAPTYEELARAIQTMQDTLPGGS